MQIPWGSAMGDNKTRIRSENLLLEVLCWNARQSVQWELWGLGRYSFLLLEDTHQPVSCSEADGGLKPSPLPLPFLVHCAHAIWPSQGSLLTLHLLWISLTGARNCPKYFRWRLLSKALREIITFCNNLKVHCLTVSLATSPFHRKSLRAAKCCANLFLFAPELDCQRVPVHHCHRLTTALRISQWFDGFIWADFCCLYAALQLIKSITAIHQGGEIPGSCLKPNLQISWGVFCFAFSWQKRQVKWFFFPYVFGGRESHMTNSYCVEVNLSLQDGQSFVIAWNHLYSSFCPQQSQIPPSHIFESSWEPALLSGSVPLPDKQI